MRGVAVSTDVLKILAVMDGHSVELFGPLRLTELVVKLCGFIFITCFTDHDSTL